MRASLAAALNIDVDAMDDSGAQTPESAMVRGRDGRLRSVDVARLAWPDDRVAAGVDYMADLSRSGPLHRC